VSRDGAAGGGAPPADAAHTLSAGDPLAVAAVQAIRDGDVSRLRRLLADHPRLARAQIANPGCADARSLLHVVADWPGHVANVAAVVRALLAAGADVDARGSGRVTETPLHWAASSDDVAAIDALLDAGADIEARGAVIAGGTPLEDAVAFGQWKAARRLLERGATVTFRQAAALGLEDIVAEGAAGAEADELSMAFWYACHGGRRNTAQLLLDRGARIDWVAPWDGLTPLDAAVRAEAEELVRWLRARIARSRAELG
jgi:hypothetical protein